jgi:hypothetical protein
LPPRRGGLLGAAGDGGGDREGARRGGLLSATGDGGSAAARKKEKEAGKEGSSGRERRRRRRSWWCGGSSDLGFSGRPREPTPCDGCGKGTACCWNTHVFAGSLPSLSFVDTGLLKIQIQHIAGDGLIAQHCGGKNIA